MGRPGPVAAGTQHVVGLPATLGDMALPHLPHCSPVVLAALRLHPWCEWLVVGTLPDSPRGLSQWFL